MSAHTSPLDGWSRLGRGAAVAASAVWLALTAHTTAGGVAPAGIVLLAATVFTAAVSVPLARYRLRSAPLAVLVAGHQVVLHQVFAEVSGCTGAPLTATVGHAHAEALPQPGVALGACPTAVHHSSLAMLALHLLATAVLVLLLVHGERAFWVAIGVLLPARIGAGPGQLQLPTGGLVGWQQRPVRADGVLVIGGVGRRGPPRPQVSSV